MTTRHGQEGYEEICLPDPRRGLWMRLTETTIELCAGREGDDAYVKLTVGEEFTWQQKAQLKEVVETVGWAFELAEDDAQTLRELPDKWHKIAKTPCSSYGWKAAHSQCSKELKSVLAALKGEENGEEDDARGGEAHQEV